MDKHCRICHNTSCSNHSKDISFLGDGWKCNYIPVPTNADNIRGMSDEELAKLLCCTGWRMIEQKECLEWLQQPAGEEDKHEAD